MTIRKNISQFLCTNYSFFSIDAAWIGACFIRECAVVTFFFFIEPISRIHMACLSKQVFSAIASGPHKFYSEACTFRGKTTITFIVAFA